jgi:hypothetical protein
MTSLPATTDRRRTGPVGSTAPSTVALGRFALGLFVLVGVAVYLDFRFSTAVFTFKALDHGWPHHPWLDVFARYDSGWYYAIAKHGYFYNGPGQQSAVAFFPAYPFSMRVVGWVVGDAIIAGVLVTLACGAGAAVLFYRWCVGFVGERTARLALGLLLLYPFAFYLFGVVYSDALFLFAALAAFSLLERDRPLLAGLAGMVATACRPVGVALVIGLALRTLEMRGVLVGSLHPRRIVWSRLRLREAGVLVSGFGLVVYSLYLWHTFHEPFAFLKVGSSAGWYRTIDLPTLVKANFYFRWRDYGLNVITFWLTMQGLFTVGALALVPSIVRRFGWGYGAYVAVAVGMAAVSSPDFVGMGRYVLVAFPVFAALAARLLELADSARAADPASADRARRLHRFLPAATLLASGLLLLWMASLFARWVFLA